MRSDDPESPVFERGHQFSTATTCAHIRFGRVGADAPWSAVSAHMKRNQVEGKAGLIRWAAIPVLITGSMFSYFAKSYEFLIDMAVCLCVIILIQRAVLLKQFFWAAGLTAVMVVFSPLFLVIKAFLLMGITCTAACAMLFAAVRWRPVETCEVPTNVFCGNSGTNLYRSAYASKVI